MTHEQKQIMIRFFANTQTSYEYVRDNPLPKRQQRAREFWEKIDNG